MDSWQCAHLHEFSFDADRFDHSQLMGLNIVNHDLLDDLYDFSPVPSKKEETTRLSDVFGPGSRLRDLLMRQDGTFLPLTYVYDFGVRSWLSNTHPLFFKIYLPPGLLGTCSDLPRFEGQSSHSSSLHRSFR
jgi:hypothetical protein